MSGKKANLAFLLAVLVSYLFGMDTSSARGEVSYTDPTVQRKCIPMSVTRTEYSGCGLEPWGSGGVE